MHFAFGFDAGLALPEQAQRVAHFAGGLRGCGAEIRMRQKRKLWRYAEARDLPCREHGDLSDFFRRWIVVDLRIRDEECASRQNKRAQGSECGYAAALAD